MEIIKHTVEKLTDPTGILTGDRYEYILSIDVPEEDELYTENGVYIKAILLVDGASNRIVQSHFIEESTNRYLDFDLEEEEVEEILHYCVENLPNE
ncbi:pullulanase [Bacillus coahuilensis p1.1.43]|uniref:Pullulanase n=1 Tax=Bacillus coahuilensis p1.1.43 TaxID=1150625 RepID=A0A147K843_9BACI|nr:DUF6509 family protein [Bacillus coahuilensis]KUP06373.1 pullulanase [Bacillus coahuilensis p1.1.43]